MASKESDGKTSWVDLSPPLHSFSNTWMIKRDKEETDVFLGNSEIECIYSTKLLEKLGYNNSADWK